MTKRKFFIDTDTASDDAVALLMALETPDVEVLGVSIVSGNMPVEQGSINARYTIELCKKDTPVYVGYDKPMIKKREHADWFHGPDGMGNMNYPEPKSTANKSDYKEVLNTLINQYPNEITLVTLGPLTNLGQFVLEYPESYQKIKDIYIMGGASTTVGNVTPAAEYNIWCDPEAAEIVFKSGQISKRSFMKCLPDDKISLGDLGFPVLVLGKLYFFNKLGLALKLSIIL